jgi:hypothetical protein
MFRARLCKAMPRKKIPIFQMVLKGHRIHDNGCSSKTQAYAIEVPFHVAPQLIPILKKVTKETKELSHSKCANKILKHFKALFDSTRIILLIQQVIAIHNIVGKDAMY